MTAGELLARLQGEISQEERAALTEGTLPMNAHNRETIQELLSRTDCPEAAVEETEVRELEDLLEGFLGQYLADNRPAWKWIRISCTYLSFLARRPLHSKAMVGYDEVEENGERHYYCRAREEGASSTCRFCVCRRKEE